MINPILFLKEVRTELSKVVWPTRKQTIRLTILVIAISVAVGFYIGALDILFITIVDSLLR